jgi:hypothetical protein
VEVSISDIQKDGSVHVTETIRFLVIGDYEKALYESGFDRNDLSFWATTTNISEVKLHLNPAQVNIPQLEFAIRPQPLRQCTPSLNLCQGEIILEYNAYPIFNQSSGIPLSGTGVFQIESPKPRTTRYILHPNAFGFTATERGDLRLEQNVYLVFHLPRDSIIHKEENINPKPDELDDAEFPVSTDELRWNNLVLVKFTLLFDVEESLDKEVVDFFADLFRLVETQLRGPEGIAMILLLLLLLGGYVYLQKYKARMK